MFVFLLLLVLVVWCDFYCVVIYYCVFFFKQKTAYEMRISDWSSDVCSSDLAVIPGRGVCHLALMTASTSCSSPVNERTRCTVGPNEIGRASCRERVCQYV